MFKAIKRLITSGLKPHSCKLCNNCYVCHECLREKNQIRQCCYGVTEEELDILHEELKNNFSLIYPVRKHSIDTNASSTKTKNVAGDSENCCGNSNNQSNFQCDICGKSFKAEYTLTRHINAHDKVGEKFKCQTCKKCFAYSKDLHMHSKIHKNAENKSRICKYCEKQFSSLYYLKIHLRRHNGIRPFKCKICSNGFTTQSMLNIHYKSHANKRTLRQDSFSNASSDSELEIIDDKKNGFKKQKTAHYDSFTNASTDSEMEIFDEKKDGYNKQKTAHDDSFTNATTDSELESLEQKNDGFHEKNFDLENFEHEESNSGISENQDFISKISDHFNLKDDFDDEKHQKNFQLSLEKYLNLSYNFESDVKAEKSYKAPLVIKLKPSE